MFQRDLRYALRQLRLAPGFACTAILTLAFGIGATTAIFSIVEGVLLRPLPFPQPSQLVTLGDVIEGVGPSSSGDSGVAAPEIRAYSENVRGFSSLAGYQETTYEFSGAGEPRQVNASRMSPGMFGLLGVGPMMGRTFTGKEDSSSQQVAVLSYPMWRGTFHGDPNILGSRIQLDRKTYEIIGVMPRDFEFPLEPGQLSRSELWIPLSLTPQEGAGAWNFSMVGRLNPGVTPQQAQQNAVPVAQEIMRGFPPFMSSLHIRPLVQALDEATIAQARPLVRTLFLAVAVVLFIACANLASLLLVRVIQRRREIAVRLALGANGRAILRQTMIETLTLSLAGGLLGLALASIGLRIGVRYLPETLPRISSIALDGRVAVFALFVAMLTGFLCGLMPAWSASRTPVNHVLKEGGRTGTSGASSARMRSVLVVAEVAVALVLLSAAGLLLRSFQKLREVNLGFHAENMLTAAYSLPDHQYSVQSSIDAFNRRLLDSLRQQPGIKTAGITTLLPGGKYNANSSFVPEGYHPPKGAAMSVAWISQVIGDYFDAAGIPLVRGRYLSTADNQAAPLACVVNYTLAHRYWPNQDPIGKRVRWGMQESSTPWMTIVGEIADVRQGGADQPVKEQIYVTDAQSLLTYGSLVPPGTLAANGGYIVVRTAFPPASAIATLRSVVHEIDPQLALMHVATMEQVVEEGRASRRFNTVLIAGFAGAAVLLALLGIYSVIAFSAALRTQEMAIRLALGSSRSGVVGLVVASGARLGLAGCFLGMLAALFAMRLMRTLLFQVDPLDPLVLLLAALSILLLALAASLLPARRAAAVEPMRALRDQ